MRLPGTKAADIAAGYMRRGSFPPLLPGMRKVQQSCSSYGVGDEEGTGG